MKTIVRHYRIFLFVLFGIQLLTIEARCQTQEKSSSINMDKTKENIESLHLTVEGMSCQAGCANGIDNMLQQQDGIIKSKTVFDSGTSEIQYDKSKISEKGLIALIEKRGFKVKVKKEDE